MIRRYRKNIRNFCRLLIENIADKNPAALNGSTPLHLAAKKGHVEIVRLIVETGVDKNSLFNGKTPLDLVLETSFRSFTLYKLLSKHKFQLCGLIFEDLWNCLPFWLCLGTVVIPLLIWYCTLTCEFDFDCHNNSLDLKRCVLPLGILVTLITVSLSIMIKVICLCSE